MPALLSLDDRQGESANEFKSCASRTEMRPKDGRVRWKPSVRPVAQPSRRRVPAPSGCEDDEGGETPPSLSGEDACATTDTSNRTPCVGRPSSLTLRRASPIVRSRIWFMNTEITIEYCAA